MSYPSWPQQLPRPERSTWQLTPQEARKRRRSDAGPPSFRRRFSSASKSVVLSVVLHRWQKSIFNSFYEQTTGNGSLLFYMPDPTTDGWPLLDSTGQPMMSGGLPILMSGNWLCSFGGQMPAETIVGMRFRITFSIEVMP